MGSKSFFVFMNILLIANCTIPPQQVQQEDKKPVQTPASSAVKIVTPTVIPPVVNSPVVQPVPQATTAPSNQSSPTISAPPTPSPSTTATPATVTDSS